MSQSELLPRNSKIHPILYVYSREPGKPSNETGYVVTLMHVQWPAYNWFAAVAEDKQYPLHGTPVA